MEMEMESHGGVSIMKRLTQHRNYVPINVALAPECSWRAAVRTRWPEQAQPSGRLTQAEGPEGQIAPVVTNGSYKKKNLDHGRATCQHDIDVQLLEMSWIPLASLSMKRISADLLVDANHDAWHLVPASNHREKMMPDFFPCRPNS